MNKFDDAVQAYEKGLELDPENATLKSSLQTAKIKADSKSVERSMPSSGAGGAGGMPDFSALSSALGGGAGGAPDFGAMLNNPALMGMAQQMMQSGALDNLMNNPNIARM